MEIGSILYNRYQIEEIIAQGGMGAIYRAVDESLGVHVAIKENLYPSEESSRQFRREATILANLRHPNLPRVTDHFVIPDQGQYLVMDFIDGEDLRKRLDREGPLSEEEVIKIGVALCEALTHLHNRPTPIIHRDIKPGNIKITRFGHIFLVDFGLAKFSQAGVSTTMGAQALTPGYAPPEQYGQGTEPRSDIYSLGATLYAALTGKLPEDGLSRAMGNNSLTPIRQHNPAVSEKLAIAIEKSMSVQLDDRYRNAEEFKQALLETSSDSTAAQAKTSQASISSSIPTKLSGGSGGIFEAPTELTPPPPHLNPPSTPLPDQASTPYLDALPQTPIPPAPARKFFLPLAGVLIGAVVLLAICGIGAFFVFSGTLPFQIPVPSNSATLTSSPILNPSPTFKPTLLPVIAPVDTLTPQVLVPSEPAPTLTFTPSATPIGGGSGEIAYASDQGGKPQIWIMKSDGSNSRQITNLVDGACQPDWSPDGARIVFISPCKERKDQYQGSGLFIANADGSGVSPLITVPGGDFEPDWSPNGKSIAFTSLRDGIPHIYIYDLQNNKVELISSPTSNDRHPEWSPDGSKIAFDTTRLGQTQVWIMSDKGKGAREFANLNNGASYMASWSPSGEIITFIQGTNLPWLTSKQYNNPAAPEVKLLDIRSLWNPSYSWDNFWLAFETVQDGNLDIFRMTPSGANMTRLTTNPGADFNPAWRPFSP